MNNPLGAIINTAKYPIGELSNNSFRELCNDARQTLQHSGVLQLADFLQPAITSQLIEHAEAFRSSGHRMDGLFPAYSDAMSDQDDDRLPADHPMRLRLPASHRFLPGDLFSKDNPLRALYNSKEFVAFVKDLLGVPAIYPVADNMGCINMLVYEPNDRNGWHFDTTDFVISLMLQPAESGGDYQYLPDLRSPENENLQAVSARMQNPDDPADIQSVDLQSGSLFLFRGKYTLHRVTQVTGNRDRVVGILSYTPRPGHVLSDSSKMAMFGRVEPLVVPAGH